MYLCTSTLSILLVFTPRLVAKKKVRYVLYIYLGMYLLIITYIPTAPGWERGLPLTPYLLCTYLVSRLSHVPYGRYANLLGPNGAVLIFLKRCRSSVRPAESRNSLSNIDCGEVSERPASYLCNYGLLHSSTAGESSL